MSMEDRVAQFHVDAQRPRDARTPKEIEKLRKFIFKNQEYRFTEREQQLLFSAVQAHFSAHQDLPPAEADGNPAYLLIDDALKMPFTVFTTNHKKTFLKWHAKLSGQSDTSTANGGGAPGAGAGPAQPSYQVYDCTADVVSLMTDEGDTVDVAVGDCDTDLVARVRELFEGGGEVRVELAEGGKSIARLVGA